jgi:hypothetical protein
MHSEVSHGRRSEGDRQLRQCGQKKRPSNIWSGSFRTINDGFDPAGPLGQIVFAEIRRDEGALDHETYAFGKCLRPLPVVIW